MRNSIKLTMNMGSVNTVKRNLTTSRSVVINSALEGINTVADNIYDNAENNCPSQTNALKSTLYKESEIDGDIIQANIGHGGKYDTINPNTGKSVDSYAVEVHEDLNKEQPKWLEKAFNSKVDDAANIIANFIRSRLGG